MKLAFEKLFGTIGPMGVRIAGAPASFFYDDPESTPAADLRSDAAALVSSDTQVEHPDLHIVDVPEGEYLTYVHFGSYEGLADAWRAFSAALESDGATDWAWCFEEYLNDCTEVPESKIQTRLLASVKK